MAKRPPSDMPRPLPDLPWELSKDGVVIAAFYDKDLAQDIRNALLEQGIKTVLLPKREPRRLIDVVLN